ncbi:V-type proton ATPase subunit e 2-like protein [Dinothrombium tinctorium]|uniref:V-type proton ATPase subunit e 2-like protein n=1 Tax=Dinothrombium tinctorium TaxID=1965070 RepID=A0A3S4RA47_9ACAR|nr:V-type proton ATPase subunit e 2-like protein [Dinothrombium tinctorium]
MAHSFVVWLVFTLLWGAIGGVLPLFIPRSDNRGIVQVMVITTAVCCYVMWLATFLSQLNPLQGPQVSDVTQLLMSKNWNS